MRDGERLPATITETQQRFAIDWQGTFAIDGDFFTFTDRGGKARTILGYPTPHVTAALDRAKA